MADFAGSDHAWNIGNRDQLCHQILSLIELDRVFTLAVLDQNRVASIAHDRRVREYLADHFGLLTFVVL